MLIFGAVTYQRLLYSRLYHCRCLAAVIRATIWSTVSNPEPTNVRVSTLKKTDKEKGEEKDKEGKKVGKGKEQETEGRE